MDAVTSRPQAAARPQPAARRKAPAQRRAEIIEAASAIAVRDGLDKVTAKRVAAAIGVRPGLVDHYFTADQLVAAAFAHAASAESDEVFGAAAALPEPADQVRHLLATWLNPGQDPISQAGADRGQFTCAEPYVAANQIFNVVDGLSVQAAIRGTLEYTHGRALIAAVTEKIL